MPTILSFICQKGGTGKSTWTKATAAYLNDHSINCVVIDSDFPQHSLYNQRQRDLYKLSKDADGLPTVENLKEAGIKPYPIDPSNVETTGLRLTAMTSSKSIQFTLIDLPGTLNVEGIRHIVKHLDVAIIPCEMEVMNVQAALDTMHILLEIRPDLRITFLWSRLDKGHSEVGRKGLEEFIRKHCPQIYIFDFIAYKSRNFRQVTTISPAPKAVAEFVDELGVFLESPANQPVSATV